VTADQKTDGVDTKPIAPDPTEAPVATPASTAAKPTDSKAGNANAASAIVAGKPKQRPSSASGTWQPPAVRSEPSIAGDDDGAGEKLQQATAALAQRNYDLAERLANAVINSSASPKLRAQARLVHGTVMCLARNDQENAQIDLRQLASFPALRNQLLKICR